ncbi:protein-L-isoaspartate O-methyltransferase family protein [Streptomyces pinistramenti]|uniref:protein-L-isoaspartate O-methyltransferase family protein n=1 Tax=Streptomyces pinistramenti TaxID=2884812 RepID=UPI001D08C718|nr:protein-L-isoaspartate O-methyltransferase [Streptomyces pinistramenti]MCB5908457.1 protein-L-isoaspartate O-methyltransferase [Streptomyces pinistramenti]
MTTTLDWTPRAQALTADLRTKNALRSETVAAAIEAVPRHLFIAGHYATGQHTTVDPEQPTDELLRLAYTDRGIMTHTPADDAGGFSSASQPSIVAKTLEAAQLRPGLKVLEIGAGTGWNAALIAHITGANVHTVEASPLVAAEAREALARADSRHVAVHTGDGYLGHPEGGPYDLILVTCGIAGISPAWLDQLAPDGAILAPVAHGGLHPLLRVTRTDADSLVGQLVANADFMNATGPLYAGAATSPATRGQRLPAPAASCARLHPTPGDLDARGSYVDLWMHLAARDARTTCAGAEGTTDYTGCALVDDDIAVFVQPGGLHPAPGPKAQDLADQVAQYVTDWDHEGRPALTAWSCTLAPAGTTEHPLLSPANWSSRERN